MKKVMNDVAFDTVSYVVSGFQQIEIYDRENINDENPVLVYKGLMKDYNSLHAEITRGYSQYKIGRSMVHKIEIKDNVMVFTLQMKYEEY